MQEFWNNNKEKRENMKTKEIGEMTTNEALELIWKYDCTPEEWEIFIHLMENWNRVMIMLSTFGKTD